MTEYKIVKTVELSGMPNPALAKDLLERLRLTTAKVVENRKWRVPVLKEFYPKNRSLLGLNVNRGKSIMIRLREGHDQMTFLPWESVLGTLVHELTHNEIGEHSAEFYKTMEKVYDEVDATSSSMGSLWGPRIAAPKYLFDGKSAKVGGGFLARTAGIESSNVRLLAAEAAMRRLGQSNDNLQVLGGNRPDSAKSRKQLFLEAEERRRSAEALGGQGCSVVKTSQPGHNPGGGGGSSSGGGSGSGSGSGVQVVAREDLGQWRWVCQVCTEENTSQAVSGASSSSSSIGGSSSSSGAVKGGSAVFFDQADALCAWCGCAYGSSLLNGGGDVKPVPALPVPTQHQGSSRSTVSKRPPSDEEIFCIDCDSPVQRKRKSSSGATGVQFVDLIRDDVGTDDASSGQPGPLRSIGEASGAGSGESGADAVLCQWTRLAMAGCPCCVPAPAPAPRTDRVNRDKVNNAVDVIVID